MAAGFQQSGYLRPPWGPVVSTAHVHCRGCRLDPHLGKYDAACHTAQSKQKENLLPYWIFSVVIPEHLYIEYTFYELFSSIPLLNYSWGAAFIF